MAGNFKFDAKAYRSEGNIENRTELARKLCEHIEAGLTAKGELPKRWQANETTYNCSGGSIDINIIDGFTAEPLPIWQPKCDRIVGSVYSSLTSLFPMVQCIDEAGGSGNVEDIELFITTLAERAGYASRNLKPCIHDAVNTNAGIMRVRPSVNEKGLVTGYEIDSMHPSNVSVYPSQVGDLKDAVTIAHRFDKMVFEVAEMVDSGAYIDPGKAIMGGDARIGTQGSEEDEDGLTEEDMGEDTEAVDSDEENVELWEVLTRVRMPGDSVRRWYLCTVWKTGEALLNIQPYGAQFAAVEGEEGDFTWYPEPWYIKHSVKHDRTTVWSPWSPANSAQTIQNRSCEIFETCLQGSLVAAFPETFISGAGVKSESIKSKPGMTHFLEGEMKVQQLANGFNPGQMMPLLEMLEQVLDSSSGVSRLGTSENVAASTTATAVQGLLQNQQKAENDYADAIAIAVEKAWQIMFWILQIHAPTILEANQTRLPETLTVEKIRELSIRMKVTGADGSATPQALLQKLQFVKQVTQGNPLYDQSKIDEKMLEALELPFTMASLRKEMPQLSQQVINVLVQAGWSPEEVQAAFAVVIQQQMAQQAAAAQMQQAQALHLQGVSNNETNGNQNGGPPGPIPQPPMGAGGQESGGPAPGQA